MPSYLVQTSVFGGDPTGTRNRLLARDGNGRLWLVHTGFDGADIQIWLSYSDDDGVTWTSEQVTFLAGSSQRSPAIAVDSSNNVHIAWDGYGWGANPARSNIQYRRRTPAGWDAQVALTDEAWIQGGAGVAVDSDDNVYVTWQGQGIVAPPLNSKIFLLIRTAVGWGATETVLSSAVIQGSPASAIDRDDNLHIVWAGRGYGANPGNDNIQYLLRSAGVWQAIEAITDVAFDQGGPYLALDSQNNVHVVWHGLGWGANPGIANIQYNQRTGAGWGTQEEVTDLATAQTGVFIGADIQDNVYASWQGTGWGAHPAFTQILYRQRTVGGWQTVVLVTDEDLTDSYHTNVLWASFPSIAGLLVDVPRLGLALAYSQITAALIDTCYYYRPAVFSWLVPPPVSRAYALAREEL